jgi:hypothetical protein
MAQNEINYFDKFFSTIENPDDLTAFDIENKWNEQNERCYWTGLLLQTDFFEHNVLSHPICPTIDKIDYSKPYSYENIVICVKMAKDGRNETGFADFHQCMAMMAHAVLTKETSPPYILHILANRQQAASTQKAMEEQKQDRNRVAEEIVQLNPKLKEYMQNKKNISEASSVDSKLEDLNERDSVISGRPTL